MKLATRSLLIAAVMAAALAFAGAASAADVVVGPELSGSWESFECGALTCTYINDELAGAGANVTSPVTGAIVGFSVVEGETAGTYKLRTATRPGVTMGPFVFSKVSPVINAVPNAGVQTYPVSLPITAGQMVGLTTSETASVGFRAVGRYSEYEIEPPETGPSLAGFSGPEIAGFNVTIQPAPTVTAVTGSAGSFTISGTDLEGATSVQYGTAAATVTSDSETQITASAPLIVPATTSVAPVTYATPISVTTVAGAASGSLTQTYTPPACVVPNVVGKKLAAAKTALAKAKCTLGTLKKLAGATAKNGKVSKQGAKAGSKLVVGSKVNLTLKPIKPVAKPAKTKKKHGHK